jgi:hypothetical protein
MEDIKDTVVEDSTPEAQEENTPRLEQKDFLKIISNALKMGSIDSRQAASMRAEMGIYGSNFTKKKVTDKQRKAKRKSQRKARAVTRARRK